MNKRIITRSPKPLTEAQRVEDWKRQMRAQSDAKKVLDDYRARHLPKKLAVERAEKRFHLIIALGFLLLASMLFACIANAATFDYGRTCMALAIYSEARGEGYDGQAAVGKVVLNRVRTGMAPSICDAVQAYGQFEGITVWPYPRVPDDPNAWRAAQAVADDVISGRYILAPDNCENALYFRSADLRLPLNAMKECKIGRHIFFQLSR